MESGKVLPFLCLILVCLLHLSHGLCPPNEELVDCRNDCNTCELQGVCYDCSTVSCDCIPDFARDTNGVCIPKSLCSPQMEKSIEQGQEDMKKGQEEMKKGQEEMKKGEEEMKKRQEEMKK
ncbi:hypothetical protein AVEN_44257-1 [Araneus ventricosus]|uniref:TIL domain-containing protein n=1 Tax=Araneus ventricosus TaxID=182803 RepID=A0A4Y2P6L1_ARAVE|nr:hypothetical protein AVEN_44257-1 [Araneus ventricosus]